MEKVRISLSLKKYLSVTFLDDEEEEKHFAPPSRKDNTLDLNFLPELSVQSILQQLKECFFKNEIYTRLGGILIAVNPF